LLKQIAWLSTLDEHPHAMLIMTCNPAWLFITCNPARGYPSYFHMPACLRRSPTANCHLFFEADPSLFQIATLEGGGLETMFAGGSFVGDTMPSSKQQCAKANAALCEDRKIRCFTKRLDEKHSKTFK